MKNFRVEISVTVFEENDTTNGIEHYAKTSVSTEEEKTPAELAEIILMCILMEQGIVDADLASMPASEPN
jgi:hypothetical protein